MSRAYKRRKKNREIGDLTYPEGGGRISHNAYLSIFRKARKKNPDMPSEIKPDYSAFVAMGNKMSNAAIESKV